MDESFQQLRRQATGKTLLEEHAGLDPHALFQTWLADALAEGHQEEPNACSLATVAEDGAPSVRIVLLKSMVGESLVFYGPLGGRKGKELAHNPRAALCFYWHELHRQVRIEGTVSPVPNSDADAYFASRPRESQIGAWASPQSEIIPDREALDRLVQECTARFEGLDIPRPDHWGGFALRPTSMEFWQGRDNRLHDRLKYSRDQNQWSRVRLAP